jgi:hypothetical protein
VTGFEFGDFRLQGFESRTHIAVLRKVLLGFGGGLLHDGQVAAGARVLDGYRIERPQGVVRAFGRHGKLPLSFEFGNFDFQDLESRADVTMGFEMRLGFRRHFFHFGKVAACSAFVNDYGVQHVYVIILFLRHASSP